MPNHDGTNQENRANQLNPNNDAYWKSRGVSRPAESTPKPASPNPSGSEPVKK